MFLDCPAWLDQDGAVRCGLPAEVRCRYTTCSTCGPLESAMIRCPAGHWFNGPIEFLTWDAKANHDPGRPGAASRPPRDIVPGSRDGADGAGRPVIGDFRDQPEQEITRPGTAPAYYLGRPAWLWMTATRPRRRRTAPDHLIASSNGTPAARS